MIVAGSVYFRKLLEVCDSAYLDFYAESVCPALTGATGRKYVVSQKADLSQTERWCKGIFNQPSERTMRFPRAVYSFLPSSGNREERWRATVFFTPIPHVNGTYGNKAMKHRISAPTEHDLGTRLVESRLADTFDLKASNTAIGSEAGLYLHLKLQSTPSLRRRYRSGKYTPPGSQLRDLLNILPTVLSNTEALSAVVELSNRRLDQRKFLDRCDERIVAALGKEKLQTMLRPAEVSADEWLRAGKRNFW